MPPFARSHVIAFFCTAAVTFAGTPTHAQSIEDARGLWFDADFEASRDAFVAVLARPSLTTPDALDAHRFLAVLSVVLDDEANARAHAEAAFALDSGVVPPEGAPTSAVELFRMARRRLGGRETALTITANGPARYGAAVSITARIDPAPPMLVRTITVRCGDEEATGATPSVTLEIEPREDVTCVAHARTEGGAPLFEAELALNVVGRPVVSNGAAEPSPARDTSRRTRRWVIAGTVAALAIGGVVTGVIIHDRNSGDVRFSGTTVVGW